MRALILAAGQGTRLRPETDSTPKCLVDVGGTTILAHQLRSCETAGIKEVVVISGYEWQQVDDEIAKLDSADRKSMKVRSLYNPFFDVSNNLVTLWVARHEMRDGFVLINGDDVFDPAILSKLLATDTHDIVVSIDKKGHYDEDDMKVVIENDKVVAINKTTASADAHGEAIGITKYTVIGALRLQKELEKMVRAKSGMTDWYTMAIESVARSGFEIGTVNIAGLCWAEVDFPEDLAHVRNNLSDLVK